MTSLLEREPGTAVKERAPVKRPPRIEPPRRKPGRGWLPWMVSLLVIAVVTVGAVLLIGEEEAVVTAPTGTIPAHLTELEQPVAAEPFEYSLTGSAYLFEPWYNTMTLHIPEPYFQGKSAYEQEPWFEKMTLFIPEPYEAVPDWDLMTYQLPLPYDFGPQITFEEWEPNMGPGPF